MHTFLELVRGGNTSANALSEFLFDELNIPIDQREREKDFFGVRISDVFTIRERFKRKKLKYTEAKKFFKELMSLGLSTEAIQRARWLYSLRENIPIRPRELSAIEKRDLLIISKEFRDLLPVVMGLKPACAIEIILTPQRGVAAIRETLRRYGLKCKIYRTGSEKTRDAIVSYIGELVEAQRKIKSEIVAKKITEDEYDIYLGLIYGYPLDEIFWFIRRTKHGDIHRIFHEEE